MKLRIRRVFDNLKAVCEAAGGTLADIAKLNIFLTDLSNFQLVNQIMGEYFAQPYPARAALGVAAYQKVHWLKWMVSLLLINKLKYRLSLSRNTHLKDRSLIRKSEHHSDFRVNDIFIQKPNHLKRIFK